jgi:macrodomain Ter protein organizer (MatP/YcbG family)
MSPKGGPRKGSGRPRVFLESRNLVIRVDTRLHERLSALAEKRGTTVSEMVRPLLERLGAKRK